MTTVADSSALVAVLLGSDSESRWTESALADDNLVCPELALAETSNILRRMELAGQISHTRAATAFADLLRLDIILFPFVPFAQRIWQLRNNLTIYDAWYVALAEALDCPLVTLDLRLSRATGPTCEIVTPS